MDENYATQYRRDMDSFSHSNLRQRDQLLIMKNELIDFKIRESRYRKEIRLIHRQLLIQFSILFILVISIFILSGLGYTIFNILERNGL